MKTIYPLKSKERRTSRLPIIFVIIIFVGLSMFGILLPNVARNTAYTISLPVWLMKDSLKNSFSGVIGFFESKKALVDRNNTLLSDIESLKLKQVDYETIIKENEDLKTTLGRKGESSRVTGAILSKPPESPYDTLVIDIGSNEGILPGSKVYISDTVLIGLVTSVTSHTSLVELFSTGGKKHEANLSRTGATYTLIGQGGANYKLEVPKDSDILWGDMFVYLGGKSSVIGSVYYIDTNSQSSFKTIYLRIPGNVFSSKWVFVEKM
jgi:cell shape-determining protein MreC